MQNSVLDDYLNNTFFKNLSNFVWFSIEIILITYFMPEGKIKEFFNIFSNLGYGYCASFIFYFINIYAPQKIELSKRGKAIAKRIIIFEQKIHDQTEYVQFCHLGLLQKTTQEMITGNVQILQKDYELLTNWVNDIEVRDHIIQNLYLTFFSHQFIKHTLPDWIRFRQIFLENLEQLKQDIAKGQSPLSLKITHYLNGTQ